jgi:predicted RNA-binding protein with PIN domain
MRYLIDGYNLLHALLGPPASSQRLEPARMRLLDRLCELPRVQPDALVIVFDALRSPAGIPARDTYRGITLHFPRKQTADDFIEDLIRLDPQPQTLTVVSNDHRLQVAARRRSCAYLGCLDWVEAMKQPVPTERRTEKPEKPESGAEDERWLKVFGGIDTSGLDDIQPLR